MASETEYLEIRNSLCRLDCEGNSLVLLKNGFRHEIDSNRRFDRIKTISHLIRVLEKRDCLSVENIDAFRTIATFFNNTGIIASIGAYGKGGRVQPLPMPIRMPTQNPNPVQARLLNPVLPTVDPDPIRRANDIICSDIGKKWKNFARALGVREGDIDSLELRYPNISDRVREVLMFHEQRSGSRRKLCDALDTARRRDLRIEVQEIFEEYHLM